MARLPKSESARLEIHEGALGNLASALVLLELVETRVSIASRQLPALMQPALEDVRRARSLIRRAQTVPAPTRPAERD